jgi:hypothetical protein
VVSDLLIVAFLGALLALDRYAGVSALLSQPLVGACLAGALLHPGPVWELWALRIPLGVGILLQLLLTDAALPGAGRPYETSSAGVIGTAVALFAMERLHAVISIPSGGLLWVVVGTVTGLLAAAAGGPVLGLIRRHNRADLPRLDEAAADGDVGAFETLYWWGVIRVLLHGAFWAAAATAAFAAAALVLLPRVLDSLHGGVAGGAFAGLLGAALAAGYFTHVRGRPSGVRWAALGALAAIGIRIWMQSGSAP